MVRVNFKIFAAIVILNFGIVLCIPKFELNGFIPSSVDYLTKGSPKSRDQLALPSQRSSELSSEAKDSTTKLTPSQANEISDRNQEPRFGFTNLGGTGTGYGVGSYAPAKIDLGGLLLGAVIGIGTVLVIPKLLYIVSGSYGTYARSDDGGVMQMMTKLDDALARHGIDTTSCMQRMVCSYSKRAAVAVREAAIETNDTQEEVSSLDRMVDGLSTNQILRTALQGTAIQEAVDSGRSGENCSRAYPQCGFSLETIFSLASHVMSAMTSADASTAKTKASTTSDVH
ncbi:uncharacterized protein LOC122512904 [Leptopilina heterotoma]|uniref:uncharacterized protein LOC122512904 n=1 Tax=Leptopilina heterotoma TaxID=63436 RepID=UPI001CA7EE27|nr:uncharacterized protein LOC122512904 [Leptopilina heterotoma]